MRKINDILIDLRNLLEKAVKLPSIKPPKAPSVPNSQPADLQTPSPVSTAPSSKKDPMKVAQQIQDPDAKTQALNSAKEKLKLAKNGQWSIEP